MTPQLEALRELDQYLTSHAVSYATIGGLAVAAWGQPRATHDADVTVLVPLESEKEFLGSLFQFFPGRIPDALEFALKSRVALITALNGIPIDVALGIPGYQEVMIGRATPLELDEGFRVPVCTPEDLIIHKIVAGRGQDVRDIEGILARQEGRLDLGYVRNWLIEFDRALGTTDFTGRFNEIHSRVEKG